MAAGLFRTDTTNTQIAVQADGSWSIQTNAGVQATVDASGEVTSIVGGEKADLKAPKVPAKPAKAKVNPVSPHSPSKLSRADNGC